MLHILEGEMDTGIHRHFYWNLDVLLNLLLEHGAARPSHCWPSLPAPPTGWPRAQSSSAAARVEVQPLCPLRVVIRPEPEYMDRCYRRPTLNWMWGVQVLILQDNGRSYFICNYLQWAPNVQNQPTLDCTARPTDVSAGVSRRPGWRVQESSSKDRNLKFSIVKFSKAFDWEAANVDRLSQIFSKQTLSSSWRSVRVMCGPLGVVTGLRCCEKTTQQRIKFNWFNRRKIHVIGTLH